METDVVRIEGSPVKNSSLLSYLEIYRNIYDNFLKQIQTTGLTLGEEHPMDVLLARIEEQGKNGAEVRNDRKSIYLNNISPACVACQTGVDSRTYYTSLQCSKKCFYCFNPNQEHYEYFLKNERDCAQEVREAKAKGEKLNFIALSGGEPLLHPQETMAFFEAVKECYPKAHTRLYTSGDFADEEMLKKLGEASLQEIRFSIRLHEGKGPRQKVLDKMAIAKNYIPQVMVEMPVFPGSYETMQEILLELDKIGIFGINLLEFCFPFYNVEAFIEKDFKVKNPPFRVLYDYWYAGGLPIDGSEEVCLQLLEFAKDQNLQLGVHYCSLENKHSGQIYRQNIGQRLNKNLYFSPRDYFLKSAKVFGDEIKPVEKRLKKAGYQDYLINQDYDFLEFHVTKIPLIKNLDVEVGLSTQVLEMREDGPYLRELKVDVISPKDFSLDKV